MGYKEEIRFDSWSTADSYPIDPGTSTYLRFCAIYLGPSSHLASVHHQRPELLVFVFARSCVERARRREQHLIRPRATVHIATFASVSV